jgi:hypothetical protein
MTSLRRLDELRADARYHRDSTAIAVTSTGRRCTVRGRRVLSS